MNHDNTHDLTVHFETLGCKVNQIESESVGRSFIEEGFTCTMGGINARSDGNDSVILCVVNTCTVTAKAEQKARRIIRLLLDTYKRSAVIVTGCYAELEKVLIENIDKRVCVLKGTHKDILADLPKAIKKNILPALPLEPTLIAEYCSHFFKEKGKKYSPVNTQRSFILSTDTFLQHSRSSIKIQDGCNSRCTYCRICLARGTSVSLEPKEVLKRVRLLEKAHQHEVTLTGINLSQYNSDGMDFAMLLSYLIENTKSIYYRISSLYPQSVTEKLCKVFASDRVRPHFHLSIQSGSESILKKMARPYSVNHVIKAVKRLSEVKEKPFIACDIIVGFPTESDADFESTKKLCEDSHFSWIHAFPFSARPETKAFFMEPKVEKQKIQERVKVLTDLAIQNKKEYIESCVGKTFKGIAEKFRKDEIHIVTENFLHVRVDPSKAPVDSVSIGGKEVLVEIEGIHKKDLRQADGEAFGRIVQVY